MQQILRELSNEQKVIVKDQIQSQQPFLKAVIEAQMKTTQSRAGSLADEVFKALDVDKTGAVEKKNFMIKFQPILNTGFQILD